MKHAQVVTAGTVTNAIVVDDDAMVSASADKIVFGEAELVAPDGSTFALYEGVGIGWTTKDGGKTFEAPPPPPTDLVAYASAAMARQLAAGRRFDVSGGSGSKPLLVLCDGTSETRADLGLLALFGQDDPGGSKTWRDNDEVETVLTGTQCVTLARLAGNWISALYPALGSILTRIAAGTIKSVADVDAAFAAATAPAPAATAAS